MKEARLRSMDSRAQLECKILTLLQERPDSSAQEMAPLVGRHKKTVLNALNDLMSAGLVKVSKSKSMRELRWRLKPI